jgi:hypothetical protein
MTRSAPPLPIHNTNNTNTNNTMAPVALDESPSESDSPFGPSLRPPTALPLQQLSRPLARPPAPCSLRSRSHAESYKIAQIGGDGIGPEVISAGVAVLRAVAKKAGFALDFTELDWSSDRYKRTGSYLPKDYIEILKQHDAIL